MKINYIDGCSGIGGMALGLQMAGIEFNNHYFSEVDEYAIKVYKKQFPRSIDLGNIRSIKKNLGSINLISAGFPCQDISIAGNQEGIEGSRSGLFYEIIRFAEALSPDIIFLENVANLLGSNEGRDMGAVLRELASIGYDAEWDCVPAAYVGANHRRDRIWVVAYSSKSRCGYGWDNRKRRKRRVGAACENVADSMQTGLQKKRTEQQTTRTSRYNTFTENARRKHGETWGKVAESLQGQHKEWNSCCEPKRPSQARNGIKVDTRTCGVDDGISTKLHRADRLKCLGNAVVPQVVEYVARIKIIPILEDLLD